MLLSLIILLCNMFYMFVLCYIKIKAEQEFPAPLNRWTMDVFLNWGEDVMFYFANLPLSSGPTTSAIPDNFVCTRGM